MRQPKTLAGKSQKLSWHFFILHKLDICSWNKSINYRLIKKWHFSNVESKQFMHCQLDPHVQLPQHSLDGSKGQDDWRNVRLKSLISKYDRLTLWMDRCDLPKAVNSILVSYHHNGDRQNREVELMHLLTL